MNYKRRDVGVQPDVDEDALLTECCMCLPLSSLQAVPSQDDKEALPYEEVTPAPPEFNTRIRAQLATFFPRSAPLSLFLLHISQLEHISIGRSSAVLYKRQRYHASVSFLNQMLINIRRAIRNHDQLLTHGGTGVAIIFPDVDQQGIQKILERIYNNVNLLQAETVIPPLEHETDVVMGVGTYPEPEASLEHLLQQVSITARKFTLRPAITSQLWSLQTPFTEGEDAPSNAWRESKDNAKHTKVIHNVPFMQLPAQLPLRLKQLIPHHIALELCCAPVGRDHHCLTVAMVDPTNSTAVGYLRKITGLTIFPVSCDISALNMLLASKW